MIPSGRTRRTELAPDIERNDSLTVASAASPPGCASGPRARTAGLAATFSAADRADRLSLRLVVSPDWAMETAVTPASTPDTMSSCSASS